MALATSTASVRVIIPRSLGTFLTGLALGKRGTNAASGVRVANMAWLLTRETF